jgi:hypothetical protein
MIRRWRFVWLLPLLWTAGCALGFAHPGDEYGLFLLDALPGLWAVALVGDDGDVAGLLLPVLACGAAVAFGIGLLLDRVQASLARWLALAAVGAVIAAVLLLRPFPDLQQATEKNGSLTAYGVCAWQLGSYAASALVLCAAAVRRAFARTGGSAIVSSPAAARNDT